MFETILLIASGSLSVIAVGIAVYTLSRAENSRLIALQATVRDLQVENAGLSDSFESLRTSVKRINSRYAMRDKRQRDKNQPDNGLPDPTTEPEAWRNAVQNKYPRGVFSINGSE